MLDKDPRIKGCFDLYLIDKDEKEFISTVDMIAKSIN